MDSKFIATVESVFSVDELTLMFDEMTANVFQEIGDEITKVGALMVSLSTNIKKTGSAYQGLTTPRSINVRTGILHHCHHNFHGFDTHYEWFHFVHKDIEKYEQVVKQRLTDNNIPQEGAWYFSLMFPGSHFQKHVDGKHPWLRYSFSIIQPETDVSLIYGDDKYFFPAGSSYVMNGECPHEVLNSAASNRLMLLGSVKNLEGSVVINTL